MTRIVYLDETGLEWVMANVLIHPREVVKEINTSRLTFHYALPYPNPRQGAVIRGDEVLVTAGPPPVELTRRHYDVLFGLIDDMKAEQIARKLNLSRRTVYLYIAELKERFAAQSRTQVVLRAERLGLAAPMPR